MGSSFIGYLILLHSPRPPQLFILISLFVVIFSGIFRGGADILVRSRLALADGVTMQLTVRSTHPDVAEIVTSAVG